MAWRQRLLRKQPVRFEGTERCLDVGCGDGGDDWLLAQRVREVVALDPEPHERWSEWQAPNLRFLRGDGENLPFAEGEFDLVFAKDMLHHAEDPERALTELWRTTRSGGQLTVFESNRYNPIGYLHMTLMLGHDHFTRKAFTRLVRAVCPDAAFYHLEARVLPIRSEGVQKAFDRIQDTLEKIPFFRPFLSYNVAHLFKRE